MNQGYQYFNQIPSNNMMYKNYTPSNYPMNTNPNDERLIGGFAFPFLLGGVTGAALAPAFNRPVYYAPAPYYYPYPPRRWY